MKGAARNARESSNDWNPVKTSNFTVNFEGRPNDQEISKIYSREKMAFMVADKSAESERQGGVYRRVNRSCGLFSSFHHA
jgi:hypothetical protein